MKKEDSVPVYKKKTNKVRYQITADTGETLGTPLVSYALAEQVIKRILEDRSFFKDLCPDTDISTIKHLEIFPTLDY